MSSPGTVAPNSQTRIPSLDGLRAVSIAFVTLSHSGLRSEQGAIVTELLQWAGAFGVTVFFVISGLLITRLLVEEDDTWGRISLGRFYVRRIFRILPAYYAFLAAMAIAGKLGRVDADGRQLASAAGFVWNYLPGPGWELAHTWSLAVEEQFYLLWPLALALLRPRRALRLAVGLVVLSPALRLLSYALMPDLRGRIASMLHTRMDGLMLGCVLALLWGTPGFEAFRRRLGGTAAMAAAAVVATSAALTVAFGGRYRLPIGYSVEALAIGVLLTWCVSRPSTAVGRILNSRPLVHLGVLSYSLYLWQQPIVSPTLVHRLALGLLGVLLVAELSYRGIERPFLRLRQRVETRLFGPREHPARKIAAA